MLFGTSASKNSMTVGGYTMTGLPVTGFAAYRFGNGAMAYGTAAEHKSNSVVSG